MDLLAVERLEAGIDALIGDLFRRVFKSPPPDYPIHFIAFLNSVEVGRAPIAYCHFTALEDCYLAGGLCFDERVFRRLSAAERAEVRRVGGIARYMGEVALAQLVDKAAVFVYVGDRRSERINLSLSFEPTAYPKLLVRWNRSSLSKSARERLVEHVGELGPF